MIRRIHTAAISSNLLVRYCDARPREANGTIETALLSSAIWLKRDVVQKRAAILSGVASGLSRAVVTNLSVGRSAMSAETRAVAPFVLSLIGGVFILLGAIVTSMFTFGSPTIVGSMSSSMSGMMGGMNGQTGMGMIIGGMMGVYPIFSIIGLASGALVILGAVMLYSRPFEKDLWGAVIIAFSILGILGGMGGFMIGLVLGIVGGALALAWNPTPKTALSTPTILSS